MEERVFGKVKQQLSSCWKAQDRLSFPLESPLGPQLEALELRGSPELVKAPENRGATLASNKLALVQEPTLGVSTQVLPSQHRSPVGLLCCLLKVL